MRCGPLAPAYVSKGWALGTDRTAAPVTARRRPPITRAEPLRLLDRRNIEGELHLVADEHVPAAERLVELHPVVGARELARDLDAHPLVAERVDVGARDLGVQDDLLGDSVEGEVTRDREGSSSIASMLVEANVISG